MDSFFYVDNQLSFVFSINRHPIVNNQEDRNNNKIEIVKIIGQDYVIIHFKITDGNQSNTIEDHQNSIYFKSGFVFFWFVF